MIQQLNIFIINIYQNNCKWKIFFLNIAITDRKMLKNYIIHPSIKE